MEAEQLEAAAGVAPGDLDARRRGRQRSRRTRARRQADRLGESCASASDRLARGLASLGLGRGDPVALVLPNVPDVRVRLLRRAAPRWRRRSAEPAVQGGRARLPLRRGRGPGGRHRRAQRGDLSGDRCATGPTRSQVVSAVDALIDGNAARHRGRRRARTPRPSSNTRPARPAGRSGCRARTGSYASRRTAWWPPPRSRPRTSSSARSPSSTRTAWAAACWPPCAPARRSCSPRTRIPFILKRDQVLAELERERATILPAVPFTFRLFAEAPGSADLSVASPLHLRRKRAAAIHLRRVREQVRRADPADVRLHRGGGRHR